MVLQNPDRVQVIPVAQQPYPLQDFNLETIMGNTDFERAGSGLLAFTGTFPMPKHLEPPGAILAGQKHLQGSDIGALIMRIGFPLQGSLKGSIVGLCNIGASIIRIGSCGPVYYNYNKEPQK